MRRILTTVLTMLMLAAIAVAQDAETALPAELQAKLDSLPDDQTRVEELERALKASPDDALLHFHLGNTYLDLKQYDQAEQHLRRSTELRENFVPGLVNLGSVYDEMGQLDKAVATYRAALAIRPDEVRTLCNLGIIFFQKRQIEQAMWHFKKALEADPNSQLTHYNMAILFADASLYREAKAEWQKVVDIDPNSDLGQRSADNIGIIDELMNAELPQLDGAQDGHGH